VVVFRIEQEICACGTNITRRAVSGNGGDQCRQRPLLTATPTCEAACEGIGLTHDADTHHDYHQNECDQQCKAVHIVHLNRWRRESLSSNFWCSTLSACSSCSMHFAVDLMARTLLSTSNPTLNAQYAAFAKHKLQPIMTVHIKYTEAARADVLQVGDKEHRKQHVGKSDQCPECTSQDVVHFNEDAAKGQQSAHERNHPRPQVPLQQSNVRHALLLAALANMLDQL
jgi:hypothetical protein